MITIEPPSSLPLGDVASGDPAKGTDAGTQGLAAGLRRRLGVFVRRAQVLAGVRGEVSVLLTDDAAMRRLNRQFRGKNKSTDVLSFPVEPMEGLPAAMQGGGDLAISLPIAAAQAQQFGHTLETELRVLLLHGLLHLAGMDHEADAGEMAERELELRKALRLPAGLIGRTEPVTSKRAKGGRAR